MRVSYQQEAGTPFLHVHAKQPLCLELGIWNQHATQPSLSTSSSLFTFSDLSRFSSGFSDTVKLILNFSRCSRFHKSNIIPTGKSTLPPSLPKAPLGSADWIAAFLLAAAALFIVRAQCLGTAAASEEDTKLFHSPCTGVPLVWFRWFICALYIP